MSFSSFLSHYFPPEHAAFLSSVAAETEEGHHPNNGISQASSSGKPYGLLQFLLPPLSTQVPPMMDVTRLRFLVSQDPESVFDLLNVYVKHLGGAAQMELGFDMGAGMSMQP